MAVAAAAPAAAQDVDTIPMPRVEASTGYMFMSHQTSDLSENYPRGWYVGMAANVTEWFSVVGEAAGSYRSWNQTFGSAGTVTDENQKIREYSFVAGPRVYRKVNRVVPFAQVLVGVAQEHVRQSTTVTGDVPWAGQSSSNRQSNRFALQPGGGIGVLLTERLGVRVAGDYRALFEIDEDSIVHEFRFLTGFTFHWGAGRGRRPGAGGSSASRDAGGAGRG
jgi:hypothetical protein